MLLRISNIISARFISQPTNQHQTIRLAKRVYFCFKLVPLINTSKKLIVGYWNIQGLIHPTRLLLAYHGTEFQDKIYKTQSEWYDQVKPNLKTDYPRLPYIQDGDFVLTESIAIIQYAATKTGNKDLLGKSQLDAIKISQTWGVCNDLRMAIGTLAREKEFETLRDQTLKEKISPFLEKFSKGLGNKEFTQGYLTWADFNLTYYLGLVDRMKPGYLDQWPNLVQFNKRLNNEGVKKYRKSENYPKLYLYPETPWPGEEKI